MPHLNKQEEKIREEWLNSDFVEMIADNFATLQNDDPIDIVDWWLNKLQEELTREREALIKEIYNLHAYGATPELREKAELIKEFMQSAIKDYAKSKDIIIK